VIDKPAMERWPRSRMDGVSAVIVVVVCGMLIAGCSSAEGGSPLPLSPASEADLSVSAVGVVCGVDCAVAAMYVQDELLTATTVSGSEKPMPPTTRRAIAEEFPSARFVTREEAADPYGEDGLIDGGVGPAVLITVGPVQTLTPLVVGVDIGRHTAPDGARFETVQFRWTGFEWLMADRSETGVTVTSSVS